MEREIHDRISFLNFLEYPDKLRDRNTIRYFREKLLKTGKDHLIFNEIRYQIMAKRIRIKKGTMQRMRIYFTFMCYNLVKARFLDRMV